MQMRRFLLAAGCALTCGAGLAGSAEILPLDQVRPGMIGIGRTVFEGSRIEEFKVTVIGVLENAVGPRQSMILARLEGGPLANTGVIAGMSGSPVSIDGKLVGAVAYGFPFSKETIAGITPIGEMLQATSHNEAPRAASARFPTAFGAAGPARPLDRDALLAALRRPLPSVAPAGVLSLAPSAAELRPLALPLTFSGFDPAAFEWARGVFSGLGFAPVMGSGRSFLADQPLPELAPGGAVGISLIEGDLDLSVTGTITHIDQGRVYAFGHPFYNLGPTQFPMRKAYVYAVFPSLYQSWKISSPAEAVGTMDQDRTTAIAGRLGATPRMIPVSVKITTSRGQERSYAFRLVDDELLSPVLAFLSLFSVLQANERTFGTSSLQLDVTMGLAGKRDLHLEDLFVQDQPSLQAAAMAAAPLAYLMSNDLERVTVEKLEVVVTSYETTRSATLERAWLERTGPVRAGSVVPLKLQLRTYRGDTVIETVPVSVPATAPAGPYTLLVADARTLTTIEQREMRQAFMPRNLDQLMRAINGLRRNNHVYARLLRADEGAIVAGEYLPSLPPSVLSVLGAPSEAAGVVPIRNASVWEFDLPTDHAVTGSRALSLAIQR